MTFLQLPIPLDLEGLKKDVSTLSPELFKPLITNLGAYGMSRSLELQQAKSEQGASQEKVMFEPTELLQGLPHLKAFADQIPGRKETFRLQKLMPGGEIRRHRDVGRSFEDGLLRIHVPIHTNEQCRFFLNGEDLFLASGACWYVDITIPHWVENRSDEERLHLMIDCERNAFWEDIFEQAGYQPSAPQPYRDLTDDELKSMRINMAAALAPDGPQDILVAIDHELESRGIEF